MRVVLINYSYNADIPTPQALLARYATLSGWARGLVGAGAQVAVVQGFRHDAVLQVDGVAYHFVADRLPPDVGLRDMPVRLHETVCALRPDVAHLNGLCFPLQARRLRGMLPAGCVLAVQHHAERPWRGPRALLQRLGLAAADGFLFAARALASPWVDARLIRTTQPVFQVMEGSTWFRFEERARTRSVTGMAGDPLFLWAGHLNLNKDPLTVLDGFARALPGLPGARLYMAYRGSDLLPEVRARLAGNADLARAVTLRGAVAHPDMEACFNSADYFVLGSHREGSGYALAEALACGVVPLVTDIPSFRVMTAGGSIGRLWPVGDADSLADALIATASLDWEGHSTAARRFFERALSFEAIGRRAVASYRDLHARRAARAGA